MQTALGEILIGARFADEGGRNDPTTFNAYEELPNKEMRFPPAFPGLADSAIYPANFDNAKRALDEAKRALGNKFGIEQSNLLWDSAFTEFKLGNIATSIDVHKQFSISTTNNP